MLLMVPSFAGRNPLQPNKFTAVCEEYAVGDFHGFVSGAFCPVSTSQTCATSTAAKAVRPFATSGLKVIPWLERTCSSPVTSIPAAAAAWTFAAGVKFVMRLFLSRESPDPSESRGKRALACSRSGGRRCSKRFCRRGSLYALQESFGRDD